MSDALLVFRSSPLSGVGFNTLRYVKILYILELSLMQYQGLT